jgi:hypothetical protein
MAEFPTSAAAPPDHKSTVTLETAEGPPLLAIVADRRAVVSGGRTPAPTPSSR